MNIGLLIFLIYLSGFIIIPLLDVFIGIGNDTEDSTEKIPTFIICLFWPLFVSFLIINWVLDSLASFKKKRIAREKAAAKLRIETETEEQKLIRQIEEEMTNETKSSHKA